jgi:hypothetical protein
MPIRRGRSCSSPHGRAHLVVSSVVSSVVSRFETGLDSNSPTGAGTRRPVASSYIVRRPGGRWQVRRSLPVVRLPGYARPLIRETDYLALVEESSYADDRVRP